MAEARADDSARASGPEGNGVHRHPGLGVAVCALGLLLVLGAWSVAGGDGYADYILVVVSGFIFFAFALSGALWRQWKKYRRADEEAAEDSETRRRLDGATPKIEILMPIAAVAVGMAAFGLLFHVVGG